MFSSSLVLFSALVSYPSFATEIKEAEQFQKSEDIVSYFEEKREKLRLNFLYFLIFYFKEARVKLFLHIMKLEEITKEGTSVPETIKKDFPWGFCISRFNITNFIDGNNLLLQQKISDSVTQMTQDQFCEFLQGYYGRLIEERGHNFTNNYQEIIEELTEFFPKLSPENDNKQSIFANSSGVGSTLFEYSGAKFANTVKKTITNHFNDLQKV